MNNSLKTPSLSEEKFRSLDTDSVDQNGVISYWNQALSPVMRPSG